MPRGDPKQDKNGKIGFYMKIPKEVYDKWTKLAHKNQTDRTNYLLHLLEKAK